MLCWLIFFTKHDQTHCLFYSDPFLLPFMRLQHPRTHPYTHTVSLSLSHTPVHSLSHTQTDLRSHAHLSVHVLFCLFFSFYPKYTFTKRVLHSFLPFSILLQYMFFPFLSPSLSPTHTHRQYYECPFSLLSLNHTRTHPCTHTHIYASTVRHLNV